MSALVLDRLVVGQERFRAGPFDLSVDEGRMLVLLGPNGSGKTTLLKTLAGALKPLAGRVARPDAGPAAWSPAPGGMDVPFTAGHLAALGRAGASGWSPALSDEARGAARAAMSELGVLDLHDRPFDRLSSGQQQRVMIARAVVQGASLCLFDEPTAMLDPTQAMAVRQALRRLAGRGAIVVAATHAIDLAWEADVVATLEPEPRYGSPDEMLRPEILSGLYGVRFTACGTCGRVHAPSSGGG